ncbi:hypothetical protein GY45DRAFT_958022 [Cubamyces sp. BRFM 1775]|nr:hypothetical protein GY45DRAFT_958022 [Cubamyces sp. BRFM 1775]
MLLTERSEHTVRQVHAFLVPLLGLVPRIVARLSLHIANRERGLSKIETEERYLSHAVQPGLAIVSMSTPATACKEIPFDRCVDVSAGGGIDVRPAILMLTFTAIALLDDLEHLRTNLPGLLRLPRGRGRTEDLERNPSPVPCLQTFYPVWNVGVEGAPLPWVRAHLLVLDDKVVMPRSVA